MKQGTMTMVEFKKLFGNEEKCREYLFHARWPEGFVCPKCGFRAKPFEITSRGKLQCRRCKAQTSLTSGTIMEKTRTPLTKWFLAIFMIMKDGQECTVQKLRQELDVAPDTAWNISSKIRHALSENEPGIVDSIFQDNAAKNQADNYSKLSR